MPRKKRANEAGLRSAETAERVADTMFALSTPSRVQILGSLVDGPLSVSNVVEVLGMEQSAVSHQLRVLRELQLVTVERSGRRMVYALADEHVLTLLEEVLRHTEGSAGRGRSFPRIRRRSQSEAEAG